MACAAAGGKDQLQRLLRTWQPRPIVTNAPSARKGSVKRNQSMILVSAAARQLGLQSWHRRAGRA